MTLADILKIYDSADKKEFDEYQFSEELRKFQTENSDQDSQELVNEIIAFDFSENNNERTSDWGTYFGPKMVWTDKDGLTKEYPSLRRIDTSILEYWQKRSEITNNPILKARYLGLIWDFSPHINGKPAPYKVCLDYISELIKVVSGDYQDNEITSFRKLKRALTLAIYFNAKDLIESCKHTIIQLEDKVSIDNKPGLWGYSYDLLVGVKAVTLSGEEEAKIIKELEEKLKRLTSKDNDGKKIDPWAAEAAATRLAEYYTKKKSNTDVKRVILETGNAFNSIISDASGMQALNWLNQLHKLYSRFGLTEEADDLLVKIRETGPKASAELKPFTSTFEIPKKEMEEYLESMSQGSLDQILHQIAVNYIPNKEEVKKQLYNLAKTAPTQFIIGQQLFGEKGRQIAKIGSLEEDLEGHIIRHVSQHLSFSSIFLRAVLQRNIDKNNLTKKEIISFINKSPVINKDRIPFFEHALDAYFKSDFLVFIHLATPQIEDILRNTLERIGGNVLKVSENRYGGHNLRTFGDLLSDSKLKILLGEDFINYFKVLFIDQRGWNIRNNVCHGISNSNSFNQQTADRLLHAILCFALIEEKKSTTA